MTSHYINGQWVDGEGDAFDSTNPVNGETAWSGQGATELQVNQAVDAAQIAFQHWALLSVNERLQYLNRYCDLLKENKADVALTISQEMGKPLWESMTEVGAMINKLKVSEQAYQQRTGVTMKEVNDSRMVTAHRPHGVVGVFGPFNFPGHLPNGHIIPALLAGNTVVFKPSSLTASVGQKMIELWEAAGLPAGVVNLVQGRVDTGQALSRANIDGLFFTGSYATGLLLHQQFSDKLDKILALELGGNNPLIVDDVDDIKAAAYHTIQSAFITSGQRCTCARRLMVPEGAAGDAFIDELIRQTKAITVGKYDAKPDVFMGSVVNAASAKQCLLAHNHLIQRGATSLLEMQRLDLSDAFITPGILDVTSLNDLPDEEVFGPLLQVIRVKNFEDAITQANATNFGLAAGILSDNKAKFQQFYLRSRAGIVNWNKPTTGAGSDAPFGGIGHSGNHRPSAYYAADYCAYPVTSMQAEILTIPDSLMPGIRLK